MLGAESTTSFRPLGEFSDIRCGDKGDVSIIAVHPRPGTDAAWLERILTPEVIALHFGLPTEKVVVHERTAVGSVIITMQNRLHGGVTRSTTTDPHGKTYSYHLFEMEVPST